MLRWCRRSRADTGWRDQIDLPLGETRGLWRVELLPAVAGAGPWETDAEALVLGAATLAALEPGAVAEIRQVGDFMVSPPLVLPLS